MAKVECDFPTLDVIIQQLQSHYNVIKKLREAKQEAEKNVSEKENYGYESEDNTQDRGKTQGMGKSSEKRLLEIILELTESLGKELSCLIKNGYIVQNSEYSDDYSGGDGTPSDQFWPIYGVRQSSAGAEYLVFDGNTEDIPDVPRGHSWQPVESQSENKCRDETLYKNKKVVGDEQRKPEGKSPQIRKISAALDSLGLAEAAGGDKQSIICIRIPLAKMVHNEQTPRADEAPPVPSPSDTGLRKRKYLNRTNNDEEDEDEEHRVLSLCKLIDGSPSDTDLRRRKTYVMSFNKDTNNAKWVYEILNEETLANNCNNVRYDNPYERGHLAAVANHRWCQEARNDVDLNSNITPQHKTLNKGNWRRLENRCRNLIKESGIRNVHVYSGPLYQTDKQMDPPELREKAVPSDFFKVIIAENENGTIEEAECYLTPNDGTTTNMQYGKLPREVFDLIQHIEQKSELTFIERRSSVREDRIITARLQGEGPNGKKHEANIQARICPNN